MPNSNYQQTNFLGGEWSLNAQGRSDLPAYHTALSVSLNGIPIQEGAWTRRSGSQFICQTHLGLAAKLLPYISDAATPYLLEFTNNNLRFFSGTSPLFTTSVYVVNASSVVSNQLVLVLNDATGLAAGDDVLLVAPVNPDYAVIGPWQNQVMNVLSVVSNTVTLRDAYGADFVGLTSTANAFAGYALYEVQRVTTTYGTSTLSKLRAVQIIQPNHTVPQAVILSHTVAPGLVTLRRLLAATARLLSVLATVWPAGPV